MRGKVDRGGRKLCRMVEHLRKYGLGYGKYPHTLIHAHMHTRTHTHTHTDPHLCVPPSLPLTLFLLHRMVSSQRVACSQNLMRFARCWTGGGGRELPGSPLSVASALLTFLAALAEPVLKCYRTNNNYYVYKLCDLMRIIF